MSILSTNCEYFDKYLSHEGHNRQVWKSEKQMHSSIILYYKYKHRQMALMSGNFSCVFKLFAANAVVVGLLDWIKSEGGSSSFSSYSSSSSPSPSSSSSIFIYPSLVLTRSYGAWRGQSVQDSLMVSIAAGLWMMMIMMMMMMVVMIMTKIMMMMRMSEHWKQSDT